MYASPVQQGSVTRRGAAWAEVARLDLPLIAAAVGLLAVSVYTLAMATQDDFPGSPLYYVVRQGLYGVVGLLLALAVSRLDIARLREHSRAIYVAMIVSIVLVFLVGAAARGSKRWIDLPFFKFQPS